MSAHAAQQIISNRNESAGAKVGGGRRAESILTIGQTAKLEEGTSGAKKIVRNEKKSITSDFKLIGSACGDDCD